MLIHFMAFDGQSFGKNQLEIYKLIFENDNPLILNIFSVGDRL